MKKITKSFGKTELAVLYYPHIQPASARRNLRTWIEDFPELREQLLKAGYRHRGVLLTPVQVQIIVDFLGEPEGVEL